MSESRLRNAGTAVTGEASESAKPAIVWFRQDLRLADNPALDAALERGGPVVPVYVWAPDEEGKWAPGGAARWWLHHSLESLAEDLSKLGSRLVIRRGESLTQLRSLAAETGADAILWNRRYEPAIIERDTRLKAALSSDGLHVRSYNSHLLFEPWTVSNRAGGPFHVFAPYWRTVQALPEPHLPKPIPSEIRPPRTWPRTLPLEALELEPKIPWAGGLRETWRPGEAGAHEHLRRFAAEGLGAYADDRNKPSVLGTSRLSPYLHWGEIGPRQVWHAIRAEEKGEGEQTHLRELGFREWSYHLLYHYPNSPDAPLDPKFTAFPYEEDDRRLEAWRGARTGYPIVDAGMRELWRNGWMHNRVRLITASFLVKDLLQPWQRGVEWFWDTLVCADLANNSMGWQWVAGTGADAAPFFRIFNPVTQGEKFDPEGEYVRRWVPELAALPNEYIHHPWEAPPLVLAAAGVELGKSYPHPIVDHKAARARALAALETIKTESTA